MRRLMETAEKLSSCDRGRRQRCIVAQVECRQLNAAFARPGSPCRLHCSPSASHSISVSDKSLSGSCINAHAAPDREDDHFAGVTPADLERTRWRASLSTMRSTPSGCAALAPIVDEDRRRRRRVSQRVRGGSSMSGCTAHTLVLETRSHPREMGVPTGEGDAAIVNDVSPKADAVYIRKPCPHPSLPIASIAYHDDVSAVGRAG